ncbi:MAG: hypothetical protein QXO21_06345 [Candidatus Anstonellales archaeon]
MENKEKKISIVEAIIAGTWLFALPDTIEFFLFFFGLDDFWISDMFAFPGSMMYLKIKGLKTTFSLVANIIELIPYAGVMPSRTIGFVITVIFENYKDKIQQMFKTTEKVAKIAKVIPATRPYAEIIEKGEKVAQTTINTLDKLDKNNISNTNNLKRINLPKSFQINNLNSLYFGDSKLKQKILSSNITESIKQEKMKTINTKNMSKSTNI